VNPIEIKFGGYQAPESIHTQAAKRFGRRLLDQLGDRVRFELVPSVLDLGHPSGALVPMVERGEFTCCYMSTVRFSERVPECRIFELPFVVRDRRRAWAALDGEFGTLLKQRIQATTGCRALGFWDNGFRHLTNKVRPIRRPEDCRGLRIRTQMTPLHGETFRALGFEPIAADIKDFVAQIAGDRFEAQDNPLTNIYTFGVHEFHRYITLTGHLWGASVFACNQSQYAGWPADVRDAVESAAAEATALQRELAEAEDANALARFDPARNEIIRLTKAEHAAFVAAVRPVREKYRGGLDPKLLAYLNA